MRGDFCAPHFSVLVMVLAKDCLLGQVAVQSVVRNDWISLDLLRKE